VVVERRAIDADLLRDVLQRRALVAEAAEHARCRRGDRLPALLRGTALGVAPPGPSLGHAARRRRCRSGGFLRGLRGLAWRGLPGRASARLIRGHWRIPSSVTCDGAYPGVRVALAVR